MDLLCDMSTASGYKNSTQIARVLSEGWLARNAYCLACDANSLDRTPPNTRCTDFVCKDCGHRYELKAFRRKPRKSLVDGAYSSLMERIAKGTAPTLFLLERDDSWGITTLTAIHSVFLTPLVIEARKPLSSNARRAGWVGCKIRIDLIGPDGEVQVVSAGQVRSAFEVRQQFRRFMPLSGVAPAERGWTTLTLSVIRSLSRQQFALRDLYKLEQRFSTYYPGNRNVRAKIRQQLQVLRDLGIVRFDGGGEYTVLNGIDAAQRGPVIV